MTENPWKQFTWIEGSERPIRQFDGDELFSLLDYFEKQWSGIRVACLVAKVCLWSWSRRHEVIRLSWSMLRAIGDEHHFEIEGKWGVKEWFRVPARLYQDLLAIRTSSDFVFAADSEQVRQFFERSLWPGPAKNVEAEFKPENLGNWFYKKIVKWSKSLSKGHATTHIFRKTSLQDARTGEDVNRQVALDARVGEGVMMTHYVKETDVQMRQSSNRTFHRILASLTPEVARRYGHTESGKQDVEKRLEAAIAGKDWPTVARLSTKLADRQRAPTG